MEMTDACTALAALGQPTRLAVFRHLVAAGKTGLPAGEIAATLHLPPSTLSGHLALLQSAGLVTARREGRFIHYTLNREGLSGLLTWLTQDCCGGRPELCLPLTLQTACAC